MSDLETLITEIVRKIVREELAAANDKPAESEMLTVAQAAATRAMSKSFIREAIADGRLPAEKFASKPGKRGSVRVRRTDLEKLSTRRTPKRAETPAMRAAKIVGGKR